MTEHEIECTDCDGYGFTMKRNLSLGTRVYEHTCAACNGHGWGAMTGDEEADAAEEQFRLMTEGEPPLTVQEAYEQAFQQKQGLRR